MFRVKGDIITLMRMILNSLVRVACVALLMYALIPLNQHTCQWSDGSSDDGRECSCPGCANPHQQICPSGDCCLYSPGIARLAAESCACSLVATTATAVRNQPQLQHNVGLKTVQVDVLLASLEVAQSSSMLASSRSHTNISHQKSVRLLL